MFERSFGEDSRRKPIHMARGKEFLVSLVLGRGGTAAERLTIYVARKWFVNLSQFLRSD